MCLYLNIHVCVCGFGGFFSDGCTSHTLLLLLTKVTVSVKLVEWQFTPFFGKV